MSSLRWLTIRSKPSTLVVLRLLFALSFDCPFDQLYFVALFPKLARNDTESSSFGLPGVC